MKPVLTAKEMATADRRALEHEPIEALIARAGAAVATHARRMLGGTYGRRVVVVAGKGHNGDDGRFAAEILRRQGARVSVIDARSAPARLPSGDLVIDAAYGTGFTGAYDAPAPAEPETAVLAVDLPSGVDADRGTASPGAVRATATVTFQALKPGLLLADGPSHAGAVVVADIGLDIGVSRTTLVEDRDVAAHLPRRARDAHKWKSAVFVCAGSPGMVGAAVLSASAAARSGAGMVRLGVPGGIGDRSVPYELVTEALPSEGFDEIVLGGIERTKVLVVGPGLGRSPSVAASIRRILQRAAIPVVLDADGLAALGDLDAAGTLLSSRVAPTILTPHDGEYARLVGSPPGDDRIGDVRSLAARTGAIVLLKGPTTVVGSPDGEIRLSDSGTPVLATAGTGDVLSGVIGAFVARGLPPIDAAALGAHVHGLAARRGHHEGLTAGDLPVLIAELLSEVLD
jgi:NAD(P)H-hydrate epimerase